MKELFKNKTVAFLGDSILADGRYMAAMRAYMHVQNENCRVYNRGIGGNRADMAECLLPYEIFSLKPDYCFVCFGGNDLGIWLYDSFVEETEEVLAARQVRDESYRQGIKTIVKELQAQGICPVLVTPYPMNELLEEKADIPTLGDNAEKRALIGPWFYKRKTFQRLNEGLEGYARFLQAYAKETGCLFCDVYTPLREAMLHVEGLYAKDGIHFSEKGHFYIANTFLRYLGYDDVPLDFTNANTGANRDIFDLEQIERSICFVQFNAFHPVMGTFTQEQILEEVKKGVADEGQPDWLHYTYETYLNYEGKREKIRDAIVRLTEEFLP